MYKEITTLEIALKSQREKMPDLSMLPKKYRKGLKAFLELQIIVNAVNNDNPSLPEWKPNYNDTNQSEWFPHYVGKVTNDGFKFNGARKNWVQIPDGGGGRLALKDVDRCHHMDEYFRDLYKDLYLITE
ncbi:MAG TPA: hypothetical protein VMU83_21615 [Hanamia sp.]|nr:hypothetical protein [Hanamia sp.]